MAQDTIVVISAPSKVGLIFGTGVMEVDCSTGTLTSGVSCSLDNPAFILSNFTTHVQAQATLGARGVQLLINGLISGMTSQFSSLTPAMGSAITANVYAKIPSTQTVLNVAQGLISITWDSDPDAIPPAGLASNQSVVVRCNKSDQIGNDGKTAQGTRNDSFDFECATTPDPTNFIVVGPDTYFYVETVALNAGGLGIGAKGSHTAKFSGSAVFSWGTDLNRTTKLAIAGGDGQTGLVANGLPTPLQARAARTDGQAQTGFPVSFSIVSPVGGSGASFSNPSAVTDSNGLASTGFTLGSSTGTYTVRAFCSQCEANPTVTFSEVAISTPEFTEIDPIFCDGSYPVGQSNPLIVVASNTFTHQGVPNFAVNFQIIQTPGGGSLSVPSVATDQNGEAQSSLTLGSTPGIYQVQVNCPNCQASPTLTCAVAAIAPPKVLETDPPGQPLTTNSSPNIQIAASANVVVPSDSNGAPLIPGFSNQASILITSTMSWTATVTPDHNIPGNGGHNHDTSRPAGFLGTLSQTSGAGNATLTFTSGQVGEQEEVIIRSADGTQESDAFINVRVPGLTLLPKNPSLYKIASVVIHK